MRAKFTAELICDVLRRIIAGELHHRIAADLDVNQDRISEIRTNAPWVLKIVREHDENSNR